ncbi:MAG: hypothetical protein Q9217_003693 [Psora testacea]
MAAPPGSLVDLEKRRAQLEENVTKLRTSLRHWQQWEIEYEGMKEELTALGDAYNQKDLLKAGEHDNDSQVPLGESQTDLLSAVERKQLLTNDSGKLRNAQEVVGLLSRRIDYVQQNIKTLTSLLSTAEEKLAASSVVVQPEVHDEKGLPVTEIHEELDEEGNVISCSTSHPYHSTPQVLEALRKAGVNELPKERSSQPTKNISGKNDSTKAELPSSDTCDSNSESTSRKSPKLEKRVSFAEATKPELDVDPSNYPKTIPDRKEEDSEYCNPAVQDVVLKDGTPNLQGNGDASSSLLQQQSDTGEENFESDEKISSPTLPKDEPLEDAALRRQMLQYNMNEVGAVVAELNLDDGDDQSWDAYSGEEDSEVNLDESGGSDEEEDEYGRTSSRVLTEEYLAEMQALAKKLKGGDMVNIGPNPKVLTETNGNAIIEPGGDNRPLNGDTTEPKVSRRKGVRFADELDIQEAHSPAPVHDSSSTKSRPNPTAKSVIERDAPTTTGAQAQPPKKRPSRFKTARAEQAPRIPTPPRDEIDRSVASPAAHKPPINAGTIVERPYDPKAKASEPDDLDPVLVNQQVNAEYHRMRNKMIYREGGFSKRDDERAEVPIDVEEEIGGKKISRFRAARLGMR